jgi:hypothetical protein
LKEEGLYMGIGTQLKTDDLFLVGVLNPKTNG